MTENLQCRLCSSEASLISLFSGKCRTTRDYIRKFIAVTTGVKFEKGDAVNYICLGCTIQGYNFYIFRTQSLQNHSKLQKWAVRSSKTSKNKVTFLDVDDISLPEIETLKSDFAPWLESKVFKQQNYSEDGSDGVRISNHFNVSQEKHDFEIPIVDLKNQETQCGTNNFADSETQTCINTKHRETQCLQKSVKNTSSQTKPSHAKTTHKASQYEKRFEFLINKCSQTFIELKTQESQYEELVPSTKPRSRPRKNTVDNKHQETQCDQTEVQNISSQTATETTLCTISSLHLINTYSQTFVDFKTQETQYEANELNLETSSPKINLADVIPGIKRRGRPPKKNGLKELDHAIGDDRTNIVPSVEADIHCNIINSDLVDKETQYEEVADPKSRRRSRVKSNSSDLSVDRKKVDVANKQTQSEDNNSMITRRKSRDERKLNVCDQETQCEVVICCEIGIQANPRRIRKKPVHTSELSTQTEISHSQLQLQIYEKIGCRCLIKEEEVPPKCSSPTKSDVVSVQSPDQRALTFSPSCRSSSVLAVQEKVQIVNICKKCDHVCYSRSELMRHMKKHLKCSSCSACFKTKKEMRNHSPICHVFKTEAIVSLVHLEELKDIAKMYPRVVDCILQNTFSNDRKREDYTSTLSLSASPTKKLKLSPVVP